MLGFIANDARTLGTRPFFGAALAFFAFYQLYTSQVYSCNALRSKQISILRYRKLATSMSE